MSAPIVFISQNRVIEGQLDSLKEYYRQVAEMTEANKPGTLAHMAYLNEEGTEMSIVHLFPDAAAMERHMVGVDELARKARDFMESVRLEIYGAPSERGPGDDETDRGVGCRSGRQAPKRGWVYSNVTRKSLPSGGSQSKTRPTREKLAADSNPGQERLQKAGNPLRRDARQPNSSDSPGRSSRVFAERIPLREWKRAGWFTAAVGPPLASPRLSPPRPLVPGIDLRPSLNLGAHVLTYHACDRVPCLYVVGVTAGRNLSFLRADSKTADDASLHRTECAETT